MNKSCLQVTRLISESCERPLRVGERVSLALHTAICAGCRNFARQMPLIGEAMRRFAAGAGDPAEPREDEKKD